MNYKSTRSTTHATPSQAILNGLAPDGGLYVPKTLMALPLESCISKTYQEIAEMILAYYFDDIPHDALMDAITSAYNTHKFSHPKITNVRSVDETTHLLELFYGETAAFKDQALSIYPYLIKASMDLHHTRHLTILTATSGDTGKAAMEALKNVNGLSIAVLYPQHGTSTMQALQMQTQDGNNVFPIGIDGDFDDAQQAVKSFFSAHSDLSISSANSINIARLLPQVIYYYDALSRLNPSTPVDIYVPTGNFGNALAAYIAKEMGCPIRKIVICTNDNNVLYDFFTTGVYDIQKRHLVKTHSPSMDILVSSNLERLLYFMFKDERKVSNWMKSLNEHQMFTLDQNEFDEIITVFDAQHMSNSQTESTIVSLFESKGILVDPHTATAFPQTPSTHPKIIVSTASPYKFPNVYRACFHLDSMSDFDILDYIEAHSQEFYPEHLKSLRDKPIKHQTFIPKDKVEAVLLDFIAKEEHA